MSLDITLYQNKCEHCGRGDEVYSANITHNLGKMAAAADIYEAVWRPEELNISKAGDLVELLAAGIKRLESWPEQYQQYNPENGWGSYERFLPWLKQYLEACKEYPDAIIDVSR